MNAANRVGIITVSDTASVTPSSDETGPLLKHLIDSEESPEWKLCEIHIVPDDVSRIQQKILQWTDGPDHLNLILTSGGTGFAVRDLTPEAISPLLHKHAPGLVHGMLSASLNITPFAVMARPVAGVRNKSVIITLPGSPKGAKENLQAILKLLSHACVQAEGVDSRALHTGNLQKSGEEAMSSAKDEGVGFRHNCHGQSRHNHSRPCKGSNHPPDAVASRLRSSPFPIISVEEALLLILIKTPSPLSESIFVDKACIGYVLQEDVKAREPVPAFRASLVDGYAIHIPKDNEGLRGLYSVSNFVTAKAAEPQSLSFGTVCRVTTGAPLPAGATSVIMVEDTRLSKSTADDREELEVEILIDEISAGANVRELGSDVSSGETILRRGERITDQGGEFALLASTGVQNISVYQKPVVGILSTGDELVAHNEPRALELGEVRDTNRPTLMNLVRSAGYSVIDFGIVSDKAAKLEIQLREALRKTDIVITSGGVSMGELDLLKPTIEQNLKGQIYFGRVGMKPGKPTTMATVRVDDSNTDREEKVIFSLPGNPASAVVTFFVFVLPMLHKMACIHPPGLPRVKVILDGDIQPDLHREEYHRATVVAKADGVLHATSSGGQRSSRIGSFKGVNALLIVSPGVNVVSKGTMLDALLMGNVISGI